MKTKQLFIVGYYGFKNTGDDSILYCLLRELHNVDSDHKYNVVALSKMVLPDDVIQSVNYVSLSPFKIMRALLKSNCVILGGGTHLYSFGKKFKSFIINMRIFLLLLVARIFRKKIYLLSIGIGTFNSSLNRWIAQKTCRLANYISVRDGLSFSYINDWGLIGITKRSFDLSLLLETGDRVVNNDFGQILGISVTPVYQVYYGKPEEDIALINSIAFALNTIMRENDNLQVNLYVFNDGKNGDTELTIELKDRLLEHGRVNLIDYIPNPKVMVETINGCGYFVGMRYHACIYAYMLSIPQLVIAYMPKCRALADEIGLSQNAILSLDDVMAGRVDCAMRDMMEHPYDYIARRNVRDEKDLMSKSCQYYKELLAVK